MRLTFTEAGWADYLWFQRTDKTLLKRNHALNKHRLNPVSPIGQKIRDFSGMIERNSCLTRKGRIRFNLTHLEGSLTLWAWGSFRHTRVQLENLMRSRQKLVQTIAQAAFQHIFPRYQLQH